MFIFARAEQSLIIHICEKSAKHAFRSTLYWYTTAKSSLRKIFFNQDLQQNFGPDYNTYSKCAQIFRLEYIESMSILFDKIARNILVLATQHCAIIICLTKALWFKILNYMQSNAIYT